MVFPYPAWNHSGRRIGLRASVDPVKVWSDIIVDVNAPVNIVKHYDSHTFVQILTQHGETGFARYRHFAPRNLAERLDAMWGHYVYGAEIPAKMQQQPLLERLEMLESELFEGCPVRALEEGMDNRLAFIERLAPLIQRIEHSEHQLNVNPTATHLLDRLRTLDELGEDIGWWTNEGWHREWGQRHEWWTIDGVGEPDGFIEQWTVKLKKMDAWRRVARRVRDFEGFFFERDSNRPLQDGSENLRKRIDLLEIALHGTTLDSEDSGAQQQQQRRPHQTGATQKHIDVLKQDPSAKRREQFDRKYGPGSSLNVLTASSSAGDGNNSSKCGVEQITWFPELFNSILQDEQERLQSLQDRLEQLSTWRPVVKRLDSLEKQNRLKKTSLELDQRLWDLCELGTQLGLWPDSSHVDAPEYMQRLEIVERAFNCHLRLVNLEEKLFGIAEHALDGYPERLAQVEITVLGQEDTGRSTSYMARISRLEMQMGLDADLDNVREAQ